MREEKRRERQVKKLCYALFFLLSIFLLCIPCNAQIPLFNTPFFPYPVFNPSIISPVIVPPAIIPAPILPPTPIATIAQLSTTVFSPPSTTIAGVIIANLIINTGNPEVKSVLLLIAADPSLLDDPFLLNFLINTGNPDVASTLAWLASVI